MAKQFVPVLSIRARRMFATAAKLAGIAGGIAAVLTYFAPTSNPPVQTQIYSANTSSVESMPSKTSSGQVVPSSHTAVNPNEQLSEDSQFKQIPSAATESLPGAERNTNTNSLVANKNVSPSANLPPPPPLVPDPPQFLNQISLSADSVTVYPKCTACAYGGYLYVAAASVFVENLSDASINLAMVSDSLAIGACAGHQLNTQGLIPIEAGKSGNSMSIEPQSFSIVPAGAKVLVTASLNEPCLSPVLTSSSVNVSLVLLVAEGGKLHRLPLTARSVPVLSNVPIAR